MADVNGARRQAALILMGIKHCGKSTQGRLLSKQFGCPFFDTDDVIQQLTQKTPRQIYTEQGESGFIAAEEQACRQLAEKITSYRQSAKAYTAVIATGGGICKNDAAVEILRTLGTIVFLNADETLAADRIVREVKIEPDGSLSNLPAYIAKEHPLTLDDVRASFHRFYEERTKKYSALCDVQVNMKAVPANENMRCILKAISRD